MPIELSCPGCGEVNLHHDHVTIYERAEDAEQTTVTLVADGKTLTREVRSAYCRNPSRRRHGLAIRFWCEHCDRKSELAISQHKGTTYLEWRNPEQYIDIRLVSSSR